MDSKQLGTELQEKVWKTHFPRSLYIELRDLLLLIAFLSGNYNVNISITKNENCDDKPNTRQFELIIIYQKKIKKADEIFWRCSSQLLSIIRKVTNLVIESLNKKRLTELYWNNSFRHYSEANSCTWTFATATTASLYRTS